MKWRTHRFATPVGISVFARRAGRALGVDEREPRARRLGPRGEGRSCVGQPVEMDLFRRRRGRPRRCGAHHSVGSITVTDNNAWHGRVGHTLWILVIWIRFTLGIRDARAAASIDTKQGCATRSIPLAQSSIGKTTGPDGGAAPSITKPISALFMLGTHTFGHVLRPCSCGTIVPNRFIKGGYCGL